MRHFRAGRLFTRMSEDQRTVVLDAFTLARRLEEENEVRARRRVVVWLLSRRKQVILPPDPEHPLVTTQHPLIASA